MSNNIKPTSEFPAVIEAKKIVQERMKFYNEMMKERKDESHLPVSEQSLVYRLRKRAEIRRQISTRKSVFHLMIKRLRN